jgi:hypothetical protein
MSSAARAVLPPFIAAVGVCLFLAACGGGDEPGSGEKLQALDKAQVAYHEVMVTGQDLSPGPCISESLPGLSDWVADIAHNPRQDVDDDPQNQCQRYRDGDAHHFVELTPSGRLIREE